MKRLAFIILLFSNYVHAQVRCDDKLWDHVYKKKRLQVIERCKTVTGTINRLKREKDGDLHIQLLLDAGQENLLNDLNLLKQKRCLVLEPVCVNEVTQASAQEACYNYVNNIYLPKKGEHVRVTGSYVRDSEGNHGWMEIHPVTKIEVIH